MPAIVLTEGLRQLLERGWAEQRHSDADTGGTRVAPDRQRPKRPLSCSTAGPLPSIPSKRTSADPPPGSVDDALANGTRESLRHGHPRSTANIATSHRAVHLRGQARPGCVTDRGEGWTLVDIDPAVLDRQRTEAKLSSMTTLAGSQLQSAAAAFAARDLTLAQQVDRDDDAIEKLNREIFEATLEQDAPDERELALRHVLIARSLNGLATTRWILPE
jgi:PhoU domain-containing protein